MRIYVAGKFEEAATVREFMDLLEDDGHEVTYDWTPHLGTPKGGEDESRRQAAADRGGVLDAQALVMLLHPKCKGAWVEVGMAVGAHPTGRRVILVTDPHVSTCVFEHLPEVFLVGTQSAARALLRQWSTEGDMFEVNTVCRMTPTPWGDSPAAELPEAPERDDGHGGED